MCASLLLGSKMLALFFFFFCFVDNTSAPAMGQRGGFANLVTLNHRAFNQPVCGVPCYFDNMLWTKADDSCDILKDMIMGKVSADAPDALPGDVGTCS